MADEYYLRFPSILKKALIEGNVSFDGNVRYEYPPIRAYRMIKRKNNDETSIQLSDFKSHVEREAEGERFSSRPDKNNIASYSCSLFIDLT